MGSPAEEFGPYVVYEQLGFGGMATVHRAETQGIAGFSKQVALKRMLPSVASNASLVKSFIREAQLASLLRHANVAQTYDLGKVGNTYFIAMELVPGRNLREILKHCAANKKPMPLPIALNIVTQLCDALDYAHELCDDSGKPLGIIHRDVSPSNIIVSEGGVVKLIDFGIAKASSQASGMNTMSGTIKGKFSYMAPEYLIGSIDARADLFAVGVIAHELLANRPLFQGKDDMDTMLRLKDMPVIPPSRINPNVPSELDHVIMTALARDPEQRWQRANAMRQALTTEIKRLKLVAHNSQVIDWIEQAFAPTSEFDEPSEPQISISPGTTEMSRDKVPDDFLHADAESMATVVKPSGSKPIQKQALGGWKPQPSDTPTLPTPARRADWRETDTTTPHSPSFDSRGTPANAEDALDRPIGGSGQPDPTAWKVTTDTTKQVRKSAPVIPTQTPADRSGGVKRPSTPNVLKRLTPAPGIAQTRPAPAPAPTPDDDDDNIRTLAPPAPRAHQTTESDPDFDDAAATLVPTRSAQVAQVAQTPLAPRSTPQAKTVMAETSPLAPIRNTPAPFRNTPVKTPVYQSQNEIVLDKLAAEVARKTPLPPPERASTLGGVAPAGPPLGVPLSGSRTTPHLPRANEPDLDAGLASVLDDLDSNPGTTGAQPRLLPTAAPPAPATTSPAAPQPSVVKTRVEPAKSRGASNFLLAVLVLIAAGGAAAVVYFALPYLTS